MHPAQNAYEPFLLEVLLKRGMVLLVQPLPRIIRFMFGANILRLDRRFGGRAIQYLIEKCRAFVLTMVFSVCLAHGNDFMGESRIGFLDCFL